MSDEVLIKPLYLFERDSIEFKKEVEEDIKTYSKLDLKSFNKDKDAYKQGLDEAISTLEDYSAKANDLLDRVNNLKKEDESENLKEKDFKKRQSSGQKTVKELQSKIEKCLKKLNQDLDKQKKADEKEDAKKAKQESKQDKKKDTDKKKESDKSENSNLRQIITDAVEVEKQQASQTQQEDQDNEDEEVDDDDKTEGKKDDEEETKVPKMPQSLKDMIARATGSHNSVDDEAQQSEQDLDDEYESEKEEIENKKKNTLAQNLINIYKNQMNKEEMEEDNKSAVSSEEKSEKEKNKQDRGLKIIETEKDVNKNQSKKKEDESDEEESENELSDGEEIKEQPKNLDQETKIVTEYQIGTKFLVIEDYEPEVEEDLKIFKGEIVEFEDLTEDAEYFLVKNSEGNSGAVPIENLELLSDKQQEELDEEIMQEEDKDNIHDDQTKIKKLKKKSKDLINTNSLIVNETVPSTFVDSVLAKVSKDSDHSYEKILKPKMSQSHLNFNNFYWNQKENKIRNRMNTILKAIVIHKCTNIPAPNKQELEVLSRALRVCLFDGVSVIGNVHTIRAHIVGRDDRNWIFEDSYKSLVSLFDFSEFFLIANTMPENPNLGLLFELSIYAKKINTNDETELCCGWAHLPFIDESQNFQLVNKSYDLVLNGGSVYDKSMPLDPNLPRNNGVINEFITKLFKESKIKFNIREPSSQAMETVSVLPSPLICSSLTANFIRFYYAELAANFIVPLFDFGSFDMSTEPVHSEFLKTFPLALQNLDILNAVRIEFNYVKDNLKKDERNDNSKLKKWFIKTYNEFYPLLFHYTMPSLDLHNHDALEQRQIIIDMLAKKIRKENKLEFLLDENQTFNPFNIEELRYEIMT